MQQLLSSVPIRGRGTSKMIKTSISRYGKRTLHNTSLHSCILEGKFGHFGHTKEPCKQSQSQEQHRKAPNPQQQNSKPRTPSSQPKIKPYTPLRTRLHTIHQRFIGSVRSRALATINQLGKYCGVSSALFGFKVLR